MPTYDYYCEEHGRFEVMFCPFPPMPLEQCPHCGEPSDRVACCPQVRFERAQLTSSEMMEGTPWEDDDGVVAPSKYVSEKPFVDLGKENA